MDAVPMGRSGHAHPPRTIGASSTSLSGRRPRSLSARQGVPGMGRRCRCRRRRTERGNVGRSGDADSSGGARYAEHGDAPGPAAGFVFTPREEEPHLDLSRGGCKHRPQATREETAPDLVAGLENRCCGDEPSSGVGHSASSRLHVAGPLDEQFRHTRSRMGQLQCRREQARGSSRSPRPDFRGRPA